MTWATWNPADLVNVTVSGGNLIATPTGQGGIRSNASVIGGKYYWEYVFGSGVATSVFLGIAIATTNLSNVSQNATLAAGFNGSGSSAVNGGGVSGALGAFGSGSVGCVALDVGAQLIWFRNGAAGSWNGSGTANPATGTGGYSISSLGSVPLYALGSFTISGAAAITANFGASAFTGVVPGGFTAGLPISVVTGGFASYTGYPNRSSGNAGASSIFLTKVTAQQNGVVNAVLLDMPGATSGINFRALIYDATPSALLASSAIFNSVVANYNRLALSTPLNIVAGTSYYVGYVCDSSLSVTITAGPSTSWFVSGSQSPTTPANPIVGGSSNSSQLMFALELDGTGAQAYGFSTDQSTGVTLSSARKVATFPTTNFQGARSVVTRLPGIGKWYAEIVIGGTMGNAAGTAVGLASVAWGVTEGGQNIPYVAFLYPNGTATIGTPSMNYSVGDTVGIAYDAVNNFMWWNKNNGSWFGATSTAGNPSTPTGGLAVQNAAWPNAVSVQTVALGDTPALTLHDTADLLHYAPPAGFSAWSGGSSVVHGKGSVWVQA